MTLDDLELLSVQLFAEFCAILHIWEATTAKRMKIDPYTISDSGPRYSAKRVVVVSGDGQTQTSVG